MSGAPRLDPGAEPVWWQTAICADPRMRGNTLLVALWIARGVAGIGGPAFPVEPDRVAVRCGIPAGDARRAVRQLLDSGYLEQASDARAGQPAWFVATVPPAMLGLLSW